MKDTPYSLKFLGKILKELENRDVINTYSIENKIINSKYKYTYVSFKINRLNTVLENKEMIRK